MRVYIINADRVIVVRQHPAELSNGEIAVASLDELRAARLTGKRLLALWNGLPGPERLSKIGDRERLLGRLWARMEALPDPKNRFQKPRSKQAAVIMMLRRANGATIDEVMALWEKYLDLEYRALGKHALWRQEGRTGAYLKVNGEVFRDRSNPNLPRHALWRPGMTWEAIGELDAHIRHPATEGASNPQARLSDMDAMGVDQALL